MTTHKVFVYGTLRPGNSPAVLVPGRIYDLGWYPGFIPGDGSHHIVAEVVEVDDDMLAQLDSYEGYSPKFPEESLYIREKHEDGFIYVYNGDTSDRPPVTSGDWLEYQMQTAGSASHMVG